MHLLIPTALAPLAIPHHLAQALHLPSTNTTSTTNVSQLENLSNTLDLTTPSTVLVVPQWHCRGDLFGYGLTMQSCGGAVLQMDALNHTEQTWGYRWQGTYDQPLPQQWIGRTYSLPSLRLPFGDGAYKCPGESMSFD